MARAQPAASAMSSMLVAFRPCPATHTAVAARMRSAMSLEHGIGRTVVGIDDGVLAVTRHHMRQ